MMVEPGIVPEQNERGLLRQAPQFRMLWLARAVSFTGDGVAQVALVLLTASRGPGAVGLVLLANALPHLLGPLAGALADRFEQRRVMILCNLGQAVGFGLLGVIATPLPTLLIVVAATSVLATLFGPAGKSSVTRLVAPHQLPRANAMLGTAANLQIIAGPAIGGVLIGLTGTGMAFVVDAASFLVCAALLTRLPSLPPQNAPVDGIWRSTAAGLRYCAANPRVRALGVGTLVFVSFAAIDNVALVFLVRGSLHGSRTEYGLIVAGFGVGLLVASLALSRFAGRVTGQRWLFAGIVIGAAGTAATGLAPDAAGAVVGQVVAGVGNTLDVVATDTLVQQFVPQHMLGRVFGSIGTAAQTGSALAYAAAAPLVAAAGARVAFLVAAGGMIVGLAALRPALKRDHDLLPDPIG